MIRGIIVAACVLLVTAVWITGQVPMPEQHPFLIRHTNLVTNVVISITTTITEVTGVKVDGQFIPTRTNLMFRTSTNVWSTP